MERTVNPELAKYMGEVNAAVKAACGVSYSEIYKDLHVDISGMREKFEAGMPSASFAELVVRGEALASIEEFGPEAREINIRRAALSAFAAEHPEWLLGGDGAIYTSDETQRLFRILPVKSKSGDAWGFAAEEVIASPEVDASNRVSVPADAPVERLGAGIDVADAVQAFDNRNDLRSGHGLH